MVNTEKKFKTVEHLIKIQITDARHQISHKGTHWQFTPLEIASGNTHKLQKAKHTCINIHTLQSIISHKVPLMQ
jgi:hypothetical protein